MTIPLTSRRLLMDGAMGTELVRRGYRGPTWRANLDAPDLVTRIHRDYVDAGAEIVLTNTFLLAEAGERVAEVARSAVLCARAAGARWVLGSLGPIGLAGVETLVGELAGVDGVLLETCSDESAFAAADSLDIIGLAVFVSFSFAPAQRDAMVRLARLAGGHRIAGLGINCGRDQSPEDIRATIKAFRAETNLPLLARPNAGPPGETLSPAEWSARVRDLDVALLGGCCGTTPEHIGLLRGARF